jgi:hypothetical protein
MEGVPACAGYLAHPFKMASLTLVSLAYSLKIR